MATFVDMTEVQRAARAQREATAAAEAANRAKSQFLATMSHEIRTPLNGVLGMAQAMGAGELSPVQRQRLEIIQASGGNLLNILNDILDLSKVEAGRLDLEQVEFDLDGLVRDACAPFAATACDKGLAFTLDIAPETPSEFVGDPVRVRQILTNLLSNALKFTDAGQIEVCVAPMARGFRLEVADTGGGVAPDRVERIFEKFVQADSSTTRRFGGTGLGLAICREIAEAMGGGIAVESTLGEGSRFTVELPLPGAARGSLEGRAQTDAADDEAHGPMRILAAEDNPVNQMVLRTVLEQFGLDVEIVETGRDALETWERGDWDMILMDVQMPVMDGPTAALRIRPAHPRARARPGPRPHADHRPDRQRHAPSGRRLSGRGHGRGGGQADRGGQTLRSHPRRSPGARSRAARARRRRLSA
jgi:nitrogen-specific signal transduction histidine kinase